MKSTPRKKGGEVHSVIHHILGNGLWTSLEPVRSRCPNEIKYARNLWRQAWEKMRWDTGQGGEPLDHIQVRQEWKREGGRRGFLWKHFEFLKFKFNLPTYSIIPSAHSIKLDHFFWWYRFLPQVCPNQELRLLHLTPGNSLLWLTQCSASFFLFMVYLPVREKLSM